MPPDHPRAPPRAEHTNLPGDASVWAAARHAFVEEGLSCPVVAERHGLHLRTVQRHAAAEDWPAMRAAHEAGAERGLCDADRAGALDDPDHALLRALRADRLTDLLVHVSGDALVREAAHLAAEAAAARRPQETLHWLRAVREADRVAERIDRALAGRSPADAFRAAFYRGDSAAEEGEARRWSAEGDGPAQG